MHQIASDLNKSKRESFFDLAMLIGIHRDCPTGDNIQQDIFRWLSPPDPWKNHHAACELRHRGSAEWFVRGNTFSEWRASEAQGSILWVHGKRALIPRSRAFAGTEICRFRSGCG
jgi:hypothetical protein